MSGRDGFGFGGGRRGRGGGRFGGGFGRRGRGRGGAITDPQSVRKVNPVFSKIDQLNPDSGAINLIAQVVSVTFTERTTATGSKIKIAEAVIGDETATIKLIARSAPYDAAGNPPADDPSKLLEAQGLFVFFNVNISMHRDPTNPSVGKMELVANRWSSIRPLKEVDKTIIPAKADAITANQSVNISAAEWVQKD